ncbi:glucokinase regulator family protein [Penicillium sp. IBT 18751x]|nr:glucokinase regulator family protein [Penicillium sp. IBT 18751x]
MLRRLSTKCGGSMTDSKLDPLLSTSNHSVKLETLLAETGESKNTLATTLDDISRKPTANFKLNTDVDLLLAVAKKDSSVMGSDRYACCCGWGHILGDEGDDCAIGLDAVKYTLTAMEEKAFGLREDLEEFDH